MTGYKVVAGGTTLGSPTPSYHEAEREASEYNQRAAELTRSDGVSRDRAYVVDCEIKERSH